VGYNQSGGACYACPPLPTGAVWDTSVVAGTCAYQCGAGLYGYPAYAGVCVLCSKLMGSIAQVQQPPVNALWLDSAGRCDPNTWECKAGFSLRLLASGAPVCCPVAPVAHAGSNSNAPQGPCGVACDSGYYWGTGAWACVPCSGPTPPAGQAWGDNCTRTFDCGRYAALTGLAVPEHAHWPPAPAGAAQCVWSCDAGYERAGGGSLCCSTTVAGYDLAGWEWAPGGCTQRCKAGLFSASANDPCVPCAQYLWQGFNIDFCQRWEGGVRTRARAR
jgi:hypothetical protein